MHGNNVTTTTGKDANEYALLVSEAISHLDVPWGTPSSIDADKWHVPRARMVGCQIKATWVRHRVSFSAWLRCRPIRIGTARESVLLAFRPATLGLRGARVIHVVRRHLATPERLATYFGALLTAWQTSPAMCSRIDECRRAEEELIASETHAEQLIGLMGMKPEDNSDQRYFPGAYLRLLSGTTRRSRRASLIEFAAGRAVVRWYMQFPTDPALAIAKFLGDHIIPDYVTQDPDFEGEVWNRTDKLLRCLHMRQEKRELDRSLYTWLLAGKDMYAQDAAFVEFYDYGDYDNVKFWLQLPIHQSISFARFIGEHITPAFGAMAKA